MHLSNESGLCCETDILEQWKKGHLNVVTKLLINTLNVNFAQKAGTPRSTDELNSIYSSFKSGSFDDTILTLIENEEFGLLHNITLSLYLGSNFVLSFPYPKHRNTEITENSRIDTNSHAEKTDNVSGEHSKNFATKHEIKSDATSVTDDLRSSSQLENLEGKPLRHLVSPSLYPKGTIAYAMAILCDKVVVANYNLAFFLVLQENYELAYLILSKLMLELKHNADNHRLAVNVGFLIIHILSKQKTLYSAEKFMEILGFMESIISMHKKKQDLACYRQDLMFVCILKAQLLVKDKKIDLFVQHLTYLLESFFKWISSMNCDGVENGFDSNVFLNINSFLYLKPKKSVLDARKIVINLTNYANKLKNLNVPLHAKPVKALIYLLISNILDSYRVKDKAQQKLNDITVDNNFLCESLAMIYNNLGVLSARQSQYASSSWYFYKSYECINNIAKEFKEAWNQNEFSPKILELSTQCLLSLENKVELLNNLAINFYNLEQYEKAYNCFEKITTLNANLHDSSIQIMPIIRHAESAIKSYMAYTANFKHSSSINGVVQNGGIINVRNYTMSEGWCKVFSKIQDNLRFASTLLESNDLKNCLRNSSNEVKRSGDGEEGGAKLNAFGVNDVNVSRNMSELEIACRQATQIHTILCWIALEMKEFYEADTEVLFAIKWLSQVSNKSQIDLFRLKLYQSEAQLKLGHLENAEKIISNLLQTFEKKSDLGRVESKDKGKRLKSDKKGFVNLQVSAECKANLYCILASIYIKKANLIQVKKFINKSLEMLPDYLPAVALRVYLFFSSGKPHDACKLLSDHRIQYLNVDAFKWE